jgi:ABC-2 type transport system ATP-binding protein
VLEVDHLTRRFGDVLAVDDATFAVPDGRLTGFVGANGAGKTSTMRMVMGVLAIHAGEVRWQGAPISTQARRSFGYMPEERGLYPKQRVVDQLVYLGRLKGMSAAEARAAAIQHLERFGLAERARERVEKLSLGNQQRVQIIASVMSRPVALILDEPFSGLDPVAVDSMTDLLREHNGRGVPVLFSSHQLDLIDRVCDRLVIMARGRIVAAGTPSELRAAGPVRHRLVLDEDAGWVRGWRGLRAVDVDGPTALVELAEDGADRALLAEALRRGRVREYARVVPPLSEIYREVTT